jgi:hypothetical protein
MLSPAQVVFDFFVNAPEGAEFSRHEIKIRLSAFPPGHIDGAISNLKRSGKLYRKPSSGIYSLVEGSSRPVNDSVGIDYHDETSRGFEAAEMRRNSKLFESA